MVRARLPTLFVTVAFLALAGARAIAAEVLPGPYIGAVEKVVDGDTLAVRVTIWVDQDIRVLVRLRGIDAPELRSRCAEEKARAATATDELARLVDGGAVVLTRIEGDKYFGRVVADVVTPEGADLGRLLTAAGHVRAYQGGKRQPWCAEGAASDEDELASMSAPE